MPDIVGTLKTPRLSAPPAGPVVGQMYYDTGTNVLSYWNGSVWVTSGSATGDPLKVDKDSVVVAATRIVASKLLSGDAQPAFRILGNGKQQWGPGGATAPDTNLIREPNPQGLGTSPSLYADRPIISGYGLQAQGGSDPALLVGYNGNRIWQVRNTGNLEWGPGLTDAVDTNLYRSAAGTLKSDGDMRVGSDLYARDGSAAGQILLSSSGIYLGTALDTRLYRQSAGVLQVNQHLYVNQSLQIDKAGAGNAIYFGTANDTYITRKAAGVLGGGPSIRADQDVAANTSAAGAWTANSIVIGHTGSGFGPYIQFGNLVDTNLYRAAANVLKTDNNMQANTFTVQQSGPNQIVVNNDGKILFGQTSDTNLRRETAGVLRTDSHLVSAQQVQSFRGAAAQVALNDKGLTGTANISFGTAADTNFWRVAAGVLRTDGVITGPDTAWHVVGAAGEPALTNGWQNYGGGLTVAQFRKTASGLVIVDGLIKTPAFANAIFTLPVGYRPTQTMRFAGMCSDYTQTCQMGVEPTGAVQIYNGNPAAAWFILGGIQFLAEQ